MSTAPGQPAQPGRPALPHSQTEEEPVAQRRRFQRRLLAAQISASLALPAGATASGLIAVEIAGPAAAALPLALLVAGSGAAALAAGAVAACAGRRASLLTAYTAALLGALLTVAAAAWASLVTLLAASALFGAGNAAAMLTRYAAADTAPPAQRGRALSRMLLALTVGAVIVPNLLGPAAALTTPSGLPGSAGLFLLATAALLAAIALLPALPDEPTQSSGRAIGFPRRSGWRSWRLPPSAVAPLGVLAVANLAMVTVMAVVPPLLHAHGASLSQVGLLVSAHVAAMYAPAPLAGHATDRHGARATALAGTLLLATATTLGFADVLTGSTGYATIVLVLIGVAWSTQVVAASTWLTHALPQPERTRAEGIGEAAMAIAATTGGLTAAPLLALGGAPAVMVTILTLTAAVAFAVFHRSLARPPRRPTTRR